MISFPFILAEADITGQSITGEAVTGKALQSSLALNITVTYPVPIIAIISPKNETYLRNESILINYSSVNSDNIWYNLDSGSNTSISGSVYVNLSQGSHTLYFYANNSYNESTIETVDFITNSTFLIILYSEYNGSTRGNSTEFINYTYEELQNLDDIVLENADYGKIRFDEAINVTNDFYLLDNIVDLDSNTNISFNRIEVGSGELPNFNTSATLWLYNLSFSNPRILRNGVVCPATDCIKESYSYPSESGGDGVLRFYVTHFTTYTLEETPSTTNPPSGGGGGTYEGEVPLGDITGLVPEDNITIISDELKVSLKPGESASQDFYLMNNYEGLLDANISVQGVGNFVSLSETKVILPYKEIKQIKINFLIPEGTPPGTYVGKIVVTAAGRIYESLVIIDVQSRESLFDISLDIDQKSVPVSPGDYILFKTSVYNIGGDENVDATLSYIIKDGYGKVVFEGEETVTIGAYFEKGGKIKIPRKVFPGKYVLSVKVTYEEKSAVASSAFDIEKKKVALIWKILIPIVIILVTLFLLWFIGKKEEKKRKRERARKEELLEY